MSVADKLGFGPKRVATQLPSGNWRIEVTPPAVLELPTCSIELTPEQMDRYAKWRNGEITTIQEAFPDLSRDDREILMSGIGPKDFDRIIKEDDNDDD